MSALPFVWELNHERVVSHIIGSPKGLPALKPETYAKDIVHYLDGKKVVFVETFIPTKGTLDAAVVDIASAMELSLKRIITEDERKIFNEHYSAKLHNKEATGIYKKGDEAEMKKIYGASIADIKSINENMVVKSIRFVKSVPTLIVANLAHFLVEPSLLTMYQDKGIKIIQ